MPPVPPEYATEHKLCEIDGGPTLNNAIAIPESHSFKFSKKLTVIPLYTEITDSLTCFCSVTISIGGSSVLKNKRYNVAFVQIGELRHLIQW